MAANNLLDYFDILMISGRSMQVWVEDFWYGWRWGLLPEISKTSPLK
jgi:hypothetical protein